MVSRKHITNTFGDRVSRVSPPLIQSNCAWLLRILVINRMFETTPKTKNKNLAAHDANSQLHLVPIVSFSDPIMFNFLFLFFFFIILPRFSISLLLSRISVCARASALLFHLSTVRLCTCSREVQILNLSILNIEQTAHNALMLIATQFSHRHSFMREQYMENKNFLERFQNMLLAYSTTR